MSGAAAPVQPEPAVALAEMREFLHLQRLPGSEGGWSGPPAGWGGDYAFGGLVIAQAVAAATADVPAGTRLHSLHAYFLRPMANNARVEYRISDVRAGRSFTARRLAAYQEEKAVLDMTYSLTADTLGPSYDLPAPSAVPPPENMAADRGPGPWAAAWIGPTEARRDGTRESTHRAWYRIPLELEDDVHLHTALVGFASDWTGTGGRPLDLESEIGGMVSLDHAVWFHRPPRADQWLYFDVQSVVNAGGRSLIRGTMRDLNGQVVASMTQEMLLTPPRS